MWVDKAAGMPISAPLSYDRGPRVLRSGRRDEGRPTPGERSHLSWTWKVKRDFGRRGGVGGVKKKATGMGTQPLGWVAMKAPPKMLILRIFHLLPGDPLMASHQGRIWAGR